MKIEFIEPFLRAAFEVLEQVLEEPPRARASSRCATRPSPRSR